MSKACCICSTEFEPPAKNKGKLTCSPDCSKKYRAEKMRESYAEGGSWVTATCANPDCNKEFKHRRSVSRSYCTHDCFNRSQAKVAKESRTCSVCGKEFSHYHRQSQNTCSVKCAATARSEGRNYPSCELCGESTGGYDRAFCDQHRGSRKGRKAIERKVAICVGCGEEFSRPGTWPGRMKYCSNKCSHHEVKSVRDKYVADLNGKAVVFHSGWEVRFWAICLRLEVDVRRYDGPDIETTEGVYRPDFIVGPDELIVEVKGWEERPGTAEKLLDAGVVLVGKESLNELEHIFNREQFLVILRKA